MSDDRDENQPNKNVQLNPAIKMSIEQAHAILGHSSEGKQTAAALSILITRGTLKTCESCSIAKVAREKAVKYNERVYHAIATVKESKDDKSLGRRTVWHMAHHGQRNSKLQEK